VKAQQPRQHLAPPANLPPLVVTSVTLTNSSCVQFGTKRFPMQDHMPFACPDGRRPSVNGGHS
jgi:hypothetical protein